MAKIKITETVLRDAHQSLIATRMNNSQIMPALEMLDEVGYYALECWGGATFDACLRFLNENPWDRLREIRKRVKNTKLQMLLRGQNILGYKNYPDEVVEEFIKKSVANGIDIIRIFDALNDIRNIEVAIKRTKLEGAHAQAAISYTISPVHTIEKYVNLAIAMRDLGADSIAIKDMSGLLLPFEAEKLVLAVKSKVDLPLELHSHYTSGLASMTYLKGIEAGVDIIDTAISPLALGTSQPPTEPMVATLKGTIFDTGIDLSKLDEVTKYFAKIREESIKSGLLDTKMLSVDINALSYQVPGGMLSNLVSQLKSQNSLDKFDEVLREVPRVREDLGFPPLVTPTSQMVGTQAVLNILSGERYKLVPKEIKDYVRGFYGQSPVPISSEIISKIIGNEKPITCRPADTMEPMLENLRKDIAEYFEEEEDLLTYALFPQVAEQYFKYRRAEKFKIESELVDFENKVHII